jgi:hypothetical protein
MLAGLFLIGATEMFGDASGTVMRSDAFVRTPPVSTDRNSKLTKAGDLVLVATVSEIHPQSAARSLKNWLVVGKAFCSRFALTPAVPAVLLSDIASTIPGWCSSIITIIPE